MAIYKCGACGKDIQTSDTDQFVVCPYCGNTNDVRPEGTVPTTYKKSNSTPIYILIAAVCVAMVVFIGGIFIFLYTKDDNNQNSEQPVVQSENTQNEETAVQAENSQKEGALTDAELPNAENIDLIDSSEEIEYTKEEIDAMVEDIRISYDATQDHIDSLTTSKPGTKFKYYYGEGGLTERVDFKIDDSTYTAWFFYRESEYFDHDLYFAFIFDGTKENRFYINNSRIIKWKDEYKKDHYPSLEGTSEELAKWSNIIHDYDNYIGLE